jgi:hypothetical protein
MNMPGFTAEASVYKSGETYQAAATQIPDSRGTGVVPQFCIWLCNYMGRCALQCFFGSGHD